MPGTPDEPGRTDIGTATDKRSTALVFDYGERRIGVAFANRATGTAMSLTTLTNRDNQEVGRALARLFEEWAPDAIVVGVPYNMDGTESPTTAAAVDFGNRLAEEFALPVDQVDERLTSAEAATILRERRRSGQRARKVRKTEIDSLAAQLIADSWLRQT
jgi:putative Holliday junction resolvase